MAIDIFATFSGPSHAQIAIPDSPLDPRSKGIRLESFLMGLENQTTIGGTSGGAGSGKATFEPIVISKAIDAQTPALAYALVSGSRYDTVTFEFFTAGGAKSPGPIYSIACRLVMINKIQQAISQGDDTLIEEITLQYGAFQIKSRPINKDGMLGKEVMSQWSKVKNNSTFDV